MKRFFGVTIGFFAGVATSVVALFVFQFWISSPVRLVERVLGWDLPAGTVAMWKKEERGEFFGEGSTLAIFSVPTAFSEKILRKCPPGFTFGTFDKTGIRKQDAAIDGEAPVCFIRHEYPSHIDVIAFSKDRLFHLQIDR